MQRDLQCIQRSLHKSILIETLSGKKQIRSFSSWKHQSFELQKWTLLDSTYDSDFQAGRQVTQGCYKIPGSVPWGVRR